MKRQGEPVSIKTLMRNLCVAMIVTLIVLGGGLTLIKTHLIEQLQVSTDEITDLNRYIGSLGLLRGYATDYASALSPVARQESELLMEELRTHGATLNPDLDQAAFALALEDVNRYMETVVQLMHEQDNAMDFAAYYNQSEQLWRSLQPRLFSFLNAAITRYTDISQSVFLQNVRSLWIIVVTIALVSLILIHYSRHVIRRVAGPVQYLTKQSLQIAGGRYIPVSLEAVSACAETQVLAQAFNMMVTKIKEQVRALENRIEAEERIHALEMENASIHITLSETERRLLQSMMNPHFLFNCLSTISSMAYLEDAEETVSVTRRISAYLHESLQSIGQEIPLSGEIAFIERYISIQKMRFGERVRLVVDCPETSHPLLVPAMLLQPLVENAISHGIASRVEGGTIWIRVCGTPEETTIVIEDNGVGISPAQCGRLNSLLESNPPPGKSRETGIGLTSTLRQMKNHFGKHAALRLSVRKEGGTCVTLHCPRQEVFLT